jgi:tetratricopeptide (TPR) repeat protein
MRGLTVHKPTLIGRTVLLGALGVLCLAAPAFAAGPPSADEVEALDPVDQAERLADDAFQAYLRQEYRQAIALYELALEAAPSADILYNIARIYDLGLSDTERAIEHYKRYIAEARAQRPRVDSARQRILELETRLSSHIEDSVQAPSAAAAAAPSGVTTSSATAKPNPAVAATTTGADVPELPGDLLRTGASASGAPAAEPNRAQDTNPRWTARELWALSASGAGLVGLAAGVGYGLSALAERDTVRRECDGNECRSKQGVNAVHSARRQANIAGAAFLTGAGLLTFGGTLWWTRPEHAESAVQAAVQLRADGARVAVSGTF